MSELKDFMDIDGRLYVACSNFLDLPPQVLELLEDLRSYLAWTIVQDAMKEAREMQKMTHGLLKEMD